MPGFVELCPRAARGAIIAGMKPHPRRRAGTRARTVLLALIASVPPPLLAAQEIPSDWRIIVDEPRELSFEVTAFPVRDGEAWIRLSGRYELALRAPFSAVLDACWLGMDESARIFSRVESSRVLERTDDAAVGEQVAGVSVMGFEFLSRASFLNTLERPAADAARVSWSLLDSDGSIRRGEGWWYFAEIRGMPEPVTYVAYYTESEILRLFPGQAGVMRAFGPGDLERMLGEFSREAYRRAGER